MTTSYRPLLFVKTFLTKTKRFIKEGVFYIYKDGWERKMEKMDGKERANEQCKREACVVVRCLNNGRCYGEGRCVAQPLLCWWLK